MNNTLGTILLVEDDESLASLVEEYLTMQGFSVYIVSRGDAVAERIESISPSLILLDIMLPGKSGLDVCRDIKVKYSIPIILLTALTDEVDQIVGLEVGADDYICKPVQPRLLLARIKALLRRTPTSNNPERHSKTLIQFDDLTINTLKQEVMLSNNIVNLTSSEFDLFVYLANNADNIVTRDDMLNHMRGFGYDGLDRTMDMLVSRLRKKLNDNASNPERIKTVWRKGYIFVSDAWSIS